MNEQWRSTREIPELHEDEDCSYLESGRLLVVVDGAVAFGRCIKGSRTGNVKWKADGHTGHFDITHWMPVPKPPAISS